MKVVLKLLKVLLKLLAPLIKLGIFGELFSGIFDKLGDAAAEE